MGELEASGNLQARLQQIFKPRSTRKRRVRPLFGFNWKIWRDGETLVNASTLTQDAGYMGMKNFPLAVSNEVKASRSR
jgi:hypothetical protein